MNAFYQHDLLREVRHDDALHHIISTVLADGDTDSNTVVPLVIHFDGHVEFIKEMDKARNETVGKAYFEQMLAMVGSAATSEIRPLSDFRIKGRYFIVAITTGTSFMDATFSTLSYYSVAKVPLPVLDERNAEKLAIGFLKLRRPKWSDEELEEIQSDTLFRIAMADTAGLPGLISLLCETKLGASYVEYLTRQVNRHVAAQASSHRWAALATIALARPRMIDSSAIEETFTLRSALDSGTVLYDETEREIRLAPVLFASYNADHELFNSLIIKPISCAAEWTWQDYEKLHTLYLAAALMALKQAAPRFRNIKLGNFLRHVKPQRNAHLEYRLILSPDEKMNGVMPQQITRKCVYVNGESHGNRHAISTGCQTSHMLAASGTPLIRCPSQSPARTLRRVIWSGKRNPNNSIHTIQTHW
jgi:hypothetical protein